MKFEPVIAVNDCPEPASYQYAIYTFYTNNPYDEGSYAVYTCDVGYKMIGEADSIIHICGKTDFGTLVWNGPVIECKGKIND